jgi:methyltransferase-like protein
MTKLYIMGHYDGRRSIDEINDGMEKKWASIREEYG